MMMLIFAYKVGMGGNACIRLKYTKFWGFCVEMSEALPLSRYVNEAVDCIRLARPLLKRMRPTYRRRAEKFRGFQTQYTATCREASTLNQEERFRQTP